MLHSFEVLLPRRQFLKFPLIAAAADRVTAAVPPPPSLVVMLVVEQLRADYLERFQGSFGAGGFRRLMSEGAYYAGCRVQSSTFPSSSLATLATGCYPDTHGIVADRWFDPQTGKLVDAGAGLMLAPNLASQEQARSLAIGVSSPPTAFLAGSEKSVFTLEGGLDESSMPGWLTATRASHSLDRYKGAHWMPLHAEASTPPLRILSEDPARPQEFQALFRASPFAQTAVLDLLRSMVVDEQANIAEGTVFVPVLLSATSALGFETGSESPLMRDLLMHLDVEIENTLAFLDKIPGPGNYALAVTGAHGAPPSLGKRKAVSGEDVAEAVNTALSLQFDSVSSRTRYVDRYVYPFLYLRPDALRRGDLDILTVRKRAGEAALRVEGVSAFYTADGFCSRGPEWAPLFANSFHATRSGDLMLSYAPEYVEAYGERGISYGSLYNYETRVPLILFGRAFKSQVFDTSCRLVDLAPTLARLMALPSPAASVGEVLYNAFAPEAPAGK